MGQGNEKEKQKENEAKIEVNKEVEKENDNNNEEDVRLYSLKSNYKSEEEEEDKDSNSKKEKEEKDSSKSEDKDKSKSDEKESSKSEKNESNKSGEKEINKSDENEKSKEKEQKNEKIKENEEKNDNIINSNDIVTEVKENVIEEKKEQKEKIYNDNNIKNYNDSTILTINKNSMNKSSSTGNLAINNNQKSKINFKVGEIRQKDIFENSKETNNINLYKIKIFNKKKCCYKCGETNFDESLSITFSCNHISCFNCILKDLMILKFKNIENKNKIQFNCSCLIGYSPQYDFNEFLEKIKRINGKKNEKSNCKEHKSLGVKYCKNCEMWLCEECLKIHSVFNTNHFLLNKEIPIKNKCKMHNNCYTEYYCLKCNEEICPFCINKNGYHSGHKTLKFDKFFNLADEIKSKLNYKTYNECLLNLENIKEKINSEKYKKIEFFEENINNLINKLINIKDNYTKKINSKIQYLNQIIDIMKESYKYYYIIILNEKQDYNNINFIRQISEIYDIKTDYYNSKDDISKVIATFDDLLLKDDLFSYNIITKEIEYQFPLLEKIFKKKYKIQRNNSNLTVRTKNNKINQIKYKEIKYFKSLKINNATIYSIIKINSEEIAVACGNEILILKNIKSDEINEAFYYYPSLKGHTKNILCLTLLSENILASGSEDKTIKIWDIANRKLIKTLSKNYKRIDSLLAYESNILIAGTYNIIRIINIDTKEELLTLIGHEKTVCSLIKFNENILISSSYDNLIKVWNFNKQGCEFTLYGHDSPVFCILLLKDGRLVSGSGSYDKSIKIWNLNKKKCEFTLVGHKREVRDIKQLSSYNIISASTDKTIKIWNLFHKNCIQTLNSHYDVIFSLCIIDRNIFCSAGRDHDIILWKY